MKIKQTKNKLKLILCINGYQLPKCFNCEEFKKMKEYKFMKDNLRIKLMCMKHGDIERRIYYYANKEIGTEENYIDGKIEGKCLFMWCNGKKMAEGKYKNGRKLGRWIYYKEDGEIDFYEYYKNGKLREYVDYEK